MVWVERSVVTFEIDRAINHYKSSLQRLVDVLLSIPDKHAELPLSIFFCKQQGRYRRKNDSVHEITVDESYRGQLID